MWCELSDVIKKKIFYVSHLSGKLICVLGNSFMSTNHVVYIKILSSTANQL